MTIQGLVGLCVNAHINSFNLFLKLLMCYNQTIKIDRNKDFIPLGRKYVILKGLPFPYFLSRNSLDF